MKQKKNCSNCINGKSVIVNNDVLCPIKGVVSADYVCKMHKFMPLILQTKVYTNMCFGCEFFVLKREPSDTCATMGLCKLFSARRFDGTKKKACSKYCSRSIPEVS